jgi:hypothetical protein
MPRITYIKKKESLVLTLYIKKLNKEIDPCSYYVRLSY